MARGYLALVLHAHLPFIRHPEYESFLEENWLFEAITECYLPLIRVFDGLVADGVPVRLTLSLSPPLLAMLDDDFLRGRYRTHIDKLSGLADKEILRHNGNPQFLELARMYRRILHETVETYDDRLGGDLVGAFTRLQDAGALELITTGATHGYLPLLRPQPSAVRAQLQVAADAYERTFGRPPPGFWLPECGYYPGLEALVRAAGGRYVFMETHGILGADPAPRHGVLAPLACANGVAAFGRDPHSSRLVWSADEGYPGDPWYRDFYKDVGFELDLDTLRPFIPVGDTRVHTGIKYHRITGPTDAKEPYEPAAAAERAAEHAADFLRRQVEAVEAQADGMDRPPLVTALYDAELFGHWWFEGPQWLDTLIRKLASDQDVVEMVTPSQYLDRHGDPQTAQPSPSSWGEKGYSEFWLNPGSDWIYPHFHDAAERMRDLARAHGDAEPESLAHRALQQAARSLLLAQASDWAFIMKTGTAVDYAYQRTRDHLARFHYLADGVEGGRIDERRLAALEYMDDIFPGIDYRVYADEGV